MSAYYNELEAFPTQWLRNLQMAGHIAAGTVDERSIKDVQPADVAGFEQAHFFAGIGGWSYALRIAGIPDSFPVWTGSCPCQPFSAAGSKRGFADERHLWPEWFRLIRECRPAVILGEQVASADGLRWLDAVFADLEGEHYACGAADLCAASVGAPHIRQRLFFVAYLDGIGCGSRRIGKSRRWQDPWEGESAGLRDARELADTSAGGQRVDRGASRSTGHASQRESACPLGDACGDRAREHARELPADEGQHALGAAQGDNPSVASDTARSHGDPWAKCDWISCSDGKTRPVEPGTFPLANGFPARMGKLRAYGNAIVPQVAATFIRAALESMEALMS